MDIHKHARLTPLGRAKMVRRVIEEGKSARATAYDFGVSNKTVTKWVARFRADGQSGLYDRSSRPRRIPRATPQSLIEQIEALRRNRLTGKNIAQQTKLSTATVSRVLHRLGLSRMKDIDPPQPPVRYQRDNPGELIHLDIKKLAKFHKPGHRVTGTRQNGQSYGAGWEYVHVCVDDRSRIAFVDIYPNEKACSSVAFLKQVVARYKRLGIRVEEVMTDNGPCYLSKAFGAACRKLSLRHIRTRPYRPQTNGKAERFIKTALAEWAYAVSYHNAEERKAALPPWLHQYNWHRPHGSLNDEPPISILGLSGNNLLRLHN